MLAARSRPAFSRRAALKIEIFAKEFACLPLYLDFFIFLFLQKRVFFPPPLFRRYNADFGYMPP